MRFFGVGGGRGWDSFKVLILSPMGLKEEGPGILRLGGVASVAAPLSLRSTDPSRSNGAMNTMTPRDPSAVVNIARSPKHIVHRSL